MAGFARRSNLQNPQNPAFKTHMADWSSGMILASGICGLCERSRVRVPDQPHFFDRVLPILLLLVFFWFVEVWQVFDVA